MEADQVIRHEPPVFHGLERLAFRVSATDFVWGGRAFVEGPVKRFNHGSKVRISVVSPLPLRCHCLAAFCGGDKRSQRGTAVGDTAASGREPRGSAESIAQRSRRSQRGNQRIRGGFTDMAASGRELREFGESIPQRSRRSQRGNQRIRERLY